VADIVDRATRSRMMSGIRGADTTPERLVRSYLHRAGLRFRLHARDLPGSPDVLLPRWRTAVFVHGCYWHRHRGCRFATTPSTNRAFWRRKFAANEARDRRNVRRLRALGWRVITVWECRTDDRTLERVVRRIRA